MTLCIVIIPIFFFDVLHRPLVTAFSLSTIRISKKLTKNNLFQSDNANVYFPLINLRTIGVAHVSPTFFFICPSAITENGCGSKVQLLFNKEIISCPFAVKAISALIPFSLSLYSLPHASPIRISAELRLYLYLQAFWQALLQQ